MSGAQILEERSATDNSTVLRGAHMSPHIHKQPLILKLVVTPEFDHLLTNYLVLY